MTELRDVPLLSTKLYIPRLSLHLVRRPRLIARLEEGLRRGHRLVLISAPAGFGKTTLLSEWIHHAGEGTLSPQVAWVSLDEGDNDPARFWAYLIAALGRLRHGVGRNALALLHSPQPVPTEAVLTTLINELAAVTAPPEVRTGPRFVLILDDYHVIEAPALHSAVAFLVEHLPPNLHLVIAGRTDPALPLARLRARGQMTELREADLRFTHAEATAFLNQATGLALSEGEVAALEARTEGWIAGLQLAALSMQGSPDVRGFIQAFGGSHRFVIDYLADEVLRQQPAEIRFFLRDTAILERLTGPLCDALTGREDGRATLAGLERANLFLIPLDDHREWYRYHRLFADLLRADLQEAEPARVPELHRRAAGWYERNGLSAEAVRHALAAGASEQAARLIEQVAPTTLWVRGEVATLLGWLASLPEGLTRSRPSLCLVHAWALLLSAQFEAVGACLQEVEAALQATQVPDDQLKRVRDEITVMRAMLANFQGDTPRAIELSQQSLALVPADNSVLRGALLGNLGGAYMEIGDAARASQSFAEAARIYRATDNTFLTLIALGFLGNMQVALGQLRQAAQTYQQTLELATEQGAQQSLGAHIAHVGLGMVLYEWHDVSAATRQLEAGIEMCERQEGVNLGPGPLMLVDGYLTMARLHHLEGHPDGVLEMLEKAERLAQAHIPPELGRIAAARARLAMAQGDLEAAVRWAQACELDAEDKARYMQEFEYLTLARVRIAEGRPDEALQLLGRLGEAAQAGSRIRSHIEILALQALALASKGQTGHAVSRLEQALSPAEAEGYVRLFVDEGAPMAALLTRVTGPYAEKLLGAFSADDRRLTADHRGPPGGASGLVEPLSERELEVLRLIADGRSNREIAAELVIAVTTAKKHVSNILGKLEVRSRTQAVARARRLGLL